MSAKGPRPVGPRGPANGVMVPAMLAVALTMRVSASAIRIASWQSMVNFSAFPEANGHAKIKSRLSYRRFG
jgi:hypothetical protein